MNLKNIFRSICPTKDDNNCFYLIGRIVETSSKYKTRKYTNVTPGLAGLLKRKYGGEYNSANQIYYMMPSKDSYGEVNCTMKDLEAIWIEVKKGEYR